MRQETFSSCAGLSLLVGAGAGATVALREHGQRSLGDDWLFTLDIALLTALAQGLLA